MDAGWRLELRSVELSEILVSVVERAQLWANGVGLTLINPPSAAVMGDADRLAQVFGNLVDNALRHTPPGGAVRLEVVVGEQWVVTSVTDTREGIRPEALPHLFERFYRASAQDRGSGLGLFIAHWIVEQQGGRLEVESEMGRGSAFRVWLPVAP